MLSGWGRDVMVWREGRGEGLCLAPIVSMYSVRKDVHVCPFRPRDSPKELKCSEDARRDKASNDCAMTSTSGARHTLKTGRIASATR